MKHCQIEEFLVQLSEKFTSNDVDGVQACLALPAVIYFGTDMIVLTSRADIEKLTRSYVSGMQEKGVRKLPLKLDEAIFSDDLITATTTSRLVDPQGNAVGLMRGKYFLRRVGSTLQVELAEHSQAPLEADIMYEPLASLAV